MKKGVLILSVFLFLLVGGLFILSAQGEGEIILDNLGGVAGYSGDGFSENLGSQLGFEDLEVFLENVEVTTTENGEKIFSPISGSESSNIKVDGKQFDLSGENSFLKVNSDGEISEGKFEVSKMDSYSFLGGSEVNNIPKGTLVDFSQEDGTFSMEIPGEKGVRQFSLDGFDNNQPVDISFNADGRIYDLDFVAGENGADFDYLGGAFNVPAQGQLTSDGNVWNFPEGSEINTIPSVEGISTSNSYQYETSDGPVKRSVNADMLVKGDNLKLSQDLTNNVFGEPIEFSGTIAFDDGESFVPGYSSVDFNFGAEVSTFGQTGSTHITFDETEFKTDENSIFFGDNSLKINNEGGANNRAGEINFNEGSPYLGGLIDENDNFAINPGLGGSSVELVAAEDGNLPVLKVSGDAQIEQDGKYIDSSTGKLYIQNKLYEGLDIEGVDTKKEGTVPMVIVQDIGGSKVASIVTEDRDKIFFTKERIGGGEVIARDINANKILQDEYLALPFSEISSPFAEEVRVSYEQVQLFEDEDFLNQYKEYTAAVDRLSKFQASGDDDLEFKFVEEFGLSEGSKTYYDLQAARNDLDDNQFNQYIESLQSNQDVESLPSLTKDETNTIISQSSYLSGIGYTSEDLTGDIKTIQNTLTVLKDNGLLSEEEYASSNLLGQNEITLIQAAADQAGVSFEEYFESNYEFIIPGTRVMTANTRLPYSTWYELNYNSGLYK